MKSTGNQLQVSGSAIYESANTREHCSTTKKVRFTARKELRGTYISVSTAVYCPSDVSLKKAFLLYKTGDLTSYLSKRGALSQLSLSREEIYNFFLYDYSVIYTHPM